MFENDQELFLGDAGNPPQNKKRQWDDTDYEVKEKRDKYDTTGLTKAQKCEMYHPGCTQSRFWQITIVGTILAGAVGFGYQLDIAYIAVVMVVAFFLIQSGIYHFCLNHFENKKLEDVASYIEQMLYSFRRNAKILASLQDTICIFEDGMMKDTLQEAIDHIITASTVGNIYEEALAQCGKQNVII